VFKLHEICSVNSQKIIKIVATRCQIFWLKCTKFDFGWGSATDPAGEAYSAPPDPLAGFEGPSAKRGEGKRAGKERREGGERREGPSGGVAEEAFCLKSPPGWSDSYKKLHYRLETGRQQRISL